MAGEFMHGRLRWLSRLPLVLSWHATVSTAPRFQGQGRPPGQAIQEGCIMTEAAVSFAGNLTDDPEVRHTESGITRAMFRVAVSGRREQEASFFTVIVGGTRPSTPASPSRRAAGWWSWAGSSSGAGPLRTATPDQSWRSWPTSWGQACGGRRRPRPGRRAARTGSPARLSSTEEAPALCGVGALLSPRDDRWRVKVGQFEVDDKVPS
jgi:hypothetical protein